MTHFMCKCKNCEVVMAQCKCPDKNKTVTFSLCDDCKNSGYIDESSQLTTEDIPRIKDVTPPASTEVESLLVQYKEYICNDSEHFKNGEALTLDLKQATQAITHLMQQAVVNELQALVDHRENNPDEYYGEPLDIFYGKVEARLDQLKGGKA